MGNLISFMKEVADGLLGKWELWDRPYLQE